MEGKVKGEGWLIMRKDNTHKETLPWAKTHLKDRSPVSRLIK